MIAPTNPIRYHSIIDVPLARPAGMSVPLLCIEGRDGSVWVSQSAYLYSRALQRRGFSVDKIQKCMRAIGLLSDFAQATAPLPRQVSQSGAQKLLEEFAEARLFGTISQDGSDPLGLYWKPVSFSTADYDCVLIAEFGEWLPATTATGLVEHGSLDLSVRFSIAREQANDFLTRCSCTSKIL